VVDVPSDGNCLFSALALGLGLPHTSSSVRRDIAAYVEDHLAEVSYCTMNMIKSQMSAKDVDVSTCISKIMQTVMSLLTDL